MEPNDVIALVVASLAAVFAAWSGASAHKALQWQRESAESARRSAEAAERSNLLAERALAIDGRTDTRRDEAAPNVRFALEKSSKNRWVLRNVGADIAEHVAVESPSAVTRNLPTDAVIRPGEGQDILMIGAFGSPIPNQLYVRWAGQSEPVAVPVPM